MANSMNVMKEETITIENLIKGTLRFAIRNEVICVYKKEKVFQ